MNKIKRIILIIGIITMNAACADTTDYKQPLYSLEFNIYGTGAEIYFNDIPAYHHDAQGQTSSQKPIPEYIIDGENTLTVKSFPLKENNNQYQPGAYIEAIISIREKNAPLSEGKPFLQLKLNPANSEDKLLDGTLTEIGDKTTNILQHLENETLAERRVTIKSPFPRWAWQDGQIIEDNQENFKSLIDEYKKVWEALNSGNMSSIKSLYDPAAQEFALAYHHQDKQQGHRIMNTGGLVGDNDWALADYNKLTSKMRYKIDVYADGHMARILDQDDRTPIMYLNKTVKMLNIQKFGFYKNKSGEWIMIR